MVKMNHPNDVLQGLIEMVRSDTFLSITKSFGMEVDFSLDSLKSVENHLEQAIKDFKDSETFSILFGIYLGETLIQTLGTGAAWALYNPENPKTTTLKLDNGEGRTILQPILAVQAFLANGTSIYAYTKAHTDVFNMTIPLVDTGSEWKNNREYSYQIREHSRRLH